MARKKQTADFVQNVEFSQLIKSEVHTMNDWTPAPDRPGYRRKIIQRGPATIIIDRPILDEAATAKAQERTRAELENVLRSYYKRTAQPVAV